MVDEKGRGKENSNRNSVIGRDDLHKVWEYRKEADNLLHQRFSFFLLAESFLVLSIVTILVSNNVGDRLKTVEVMISLLGIVFTFGWWYVNVRIRIRLDHLKENYMNKDSIYNEYLSSVKEPINKVIKKLHINTLILPLSTLFFWWIMLFEVILNYDRFCYGVFLMVFFVILYFIMPKKNYL